MRVDETSELLAEMVSAGDKKSALAFAAAVLEAGFAIHKDDDTSLKNVAKPTISIHPVLTQVESYY